MNKENGNKNAEISARIAEILQYTGDTRNSFAVKLGYDRAQTVYDIINMKSAPSYDFFRRFSISEYSDIVDLKWLLSGRGSMLCNSQTTEEAKNSTPTNISVSNTDDSVIYKIYKEKDLEVKDLMETIGSLKEQIRQLKREKGRSASDGPDSTHANVG